MARKTPVENLSPQEKLGNPPAWHPNDEVALLKAAIQAVGK